MHNLRSVLGRRGWLATALVIIAGSCGVFTPHAAAQTTAETRAVFLLNFARFIEWPESAFTDQRTPLTIAVVGEPEVARAVERLAKGKMAHGRDIQVIAVASSAEAADVHIVFVGKDDLAKSVIDAVKTRPVVTVGEGESFLQEGGVIRLIASGNKLQCAINVKISDALGLKLGDKLIRASES